MPYTEVIEWHRRHRAMMAVFNSSEGLIAVMAMVFGLILITQMGLTYDVVAKSISNATPWLSPRWHGTLLIMVAVTHVMGICIDSAGFRWWCVFLELLFFTFSWCSLVAANAYVPMLLALPVLIVYCIPNLVALATPRKRSDNAMANAGMGNGGDGAAGNPDNRVGQ